MVRGGPPPQVGDPVYRAVGAAVRSVLADPRYRSRAQEMAASMSRAGGFTRLAEIVDGLAVSAR